MPPEDSSHPQVFISYSHDSPEHQRRVLELSERLRADGIDAGSISTPPGPARAGRGGWKGNCGKPVLS